MATTSRSPQRPIDSPPPTSFLQLYYCLYNSATVSTTLLLSSFTRKLELAANSPIQFDGECLLTQSAMRGRHERFRLNFGEQPMGSRWISESMTTWKINFLDRAPPSIPRNLVLGDTDVDSAGTGTTSTSRNQPQDNFSAPASLVHVATRPLSSSDSNFNYVPFVAIECHGSIEPYCFNIEGSIFNVLSKSGKKFESISLESGGNWSDYDEASDATVIVAGLEGKWERYTEGNLLPGGCRSYDY